MITGAAGGDRPVDPPLGGISTPKMVLHITVKRYSEVTFFHLWKYFLSDSQRSEYTKTILSVIFLTDFYKNNKKIMFFYIVYIFIHIITAKFSKSRNNMKIYENKFLSNQRTLFISVKSNQSSRIAKQVYRRA